MKEVKKKSLKGHLFSDTGKLQTQQSLANRGFATAAFGFMYPGVLICVHIENR
jgi:hypothetical protein